MTACLSELFSPTDLFSYAYLTNSHDGVIILLANPFWMGL